MDATSVGSTVAERVARGLEWLRSEDAQRFTPDLSRIDLSNFDITNTRQCVLGQAIPAGEWYSGYNRVHGELLVNEDREDTDWMASHGFYGPDQDWADLEAEWRRVLSA